MRYTKVNFTLGTGPSGDSTLAHEGVLILDLPTGRARLLSCCFQTVAFHETRDPARENPMKAIVQDRYGTADVLELEDVDEPKVASGDVLLRVHAASAHVGDWHFMTGLPYLFRIAGSGLRAPKTAARNIRLNTELVAPWQGSSSASASRNASMRCKL